MREERYNSPRFLYKYSAKTNQQILTNLIFIIMKNRIFLAILLACALMACSNSTPKYVGNTYEGSIGYGTLTYQFLDLNEFRVDIVLTVLISAMRALLYYALNAIVKILLSALHAKISHVLNMYTVARSATRNVSV